MKTAILGTDLSDASERIIENAAEFRLLGIERVILVYVLNLRNTDDFAEYDMEFAQTRMSRQKEALAGLGFSVETKIVMGIPANELMRLAKVNEADLVIIGSRGKTWSKSSLGETASEVLHNIKCPVLLLAFNKAPIDKQLEESFNEDVKHYEKFVSKFRQQEHKTELLHKKVNGHVLLTTDFSDFSENAFRWLANRLAPIPKLTLLHIQDAVRISKHLENKLEEFNRIDTARLERLRDEFSRVHPESEVDIVLQYGIPKQLIPQYIRDNQITLAVMGSQGRGYIAEFFLGSVSLRVARQADTNLLVLPFNKK